MSTCAHCNGPVTGGGHAGRRGAVYCCFGCLDLGELACETGGCSPSGIDSAKLGGTGVRLGIGVLVVGQSMIFGLALNLHDDVPPAARELTQWCILAGTALVMLLLGGPLVRATWTELRRGRLTIEALFLLTMSGALAASLQAHLTGRGKIYFEVVSVLLVVYTLGKLIGARSRAAALAASRAWGDRLGRCRLVDATGATRTVPVADVRRGDLVAVRPGELIAVDGVVRDGAGFVSEAAVSGEPFAAVRRPGDRVLAGSASCDAAFRIAATADGTDRQVDRLLAAVEAARAAPLSLQARADRLGQWFLPLVAATALGTFAYWALLTPAGWEAGLFNAMSVLLVACPCVIGLATPVVIWTALGRLAERGVIVRSGDLIERLATVDRVMFDKTGTLTEDRFALVDIETTGAGAERPALLGWLALVQAQSPHPIAKPFADLPRPFAPGAEPRVTALTAVPGCGVLAELREATGARHEIRIGTREFVPGAPSGGAAPPAPGARVVYVAVDGALAAVATVAERLRDSAPQALARLTALGLPVEVLTGDATGRAEALGLPAARGGLLPDDKRAAVEAARAAGASPLFVGDGINDASALAAAHVGVALASGTDLAVTAAAVTLYHGDLRALPWAIELSRDAVRAVRRNLRRAVCYNLVGMALAASGVLHPVVAAVLMVVSSLTLVLSSTRVGDGRGLRTAPARGGLTPPENPRLVRPHALGRRFRSAARLVDFFDIHLAIRLLGGLTPPARRADLPRREGLLWRAIVHGLALALQGAAFLLLLAPLREPALAALVLSGFALTGAIGAALWHRVAVPHWLDMCVGMVTLGNLGMVLGWWADNGCAALRDAGCCHCVDAARDGALKPWMWVGMLVAANGAMRWLGRCPAPDRWHTVAMYSGGNVGMVAGMIAGGWCAARIPIESVTAAVAAGFAGMTAGMLAGMLAGTWGTERVLLALRGVRTAVRAVTPVRTS